MLVAQAVFAAEHFTGKALDADTLLVCKQLGISPDDVKKYGMKED